MYVFIGESGNDGFEFDKDDVSTYFVVTAIIVKEDKIDSLRQDVEEVRQQYLQAEEMKLSKVKSSKERKTIIQTLLDKDFSIYSIVIDKQKLNKEGGLGYKESFFKFCHGLLYRILFETNSTIEIFADHCGNEAFIKGFETYIHKRHQPTLFNHSSIVTESSKNNVLLQLADLMSDTIFQKYEQKSSDYNEILKLLTKKIKRIEEWPEYDLEAIKRENAIDDNSFDEIILDQTVKSTKEFINKNESSTDQYEQNQVNFLKYLLTCLSVGRNHYIKSDEIIKNLEEFSKETITKDYLMRNIIGPLRDQRLLVASTTSGYKLPTSQRDIIDFIEFSSSIVLPMLSRIDKSRDRILFATNNELDILHGEKFKELRRYFDDKYLRG